ncbi:hypothetical protein PoB_003633400 [Plakobranchus ocellatus]|uniref:Galectin n=1 Tax=Plakobranchus ocellatus TaxID=259542 RepID=A0AAV4APV5_9GAST|nr:hypothetical protein PoB_003633400 [Plakobranchus ocellatus]
MLHYRGDSEQPNSLMLIDGLPMLPPPPPPPVPAAGNHEIGLPIAFGEADTPHSPPVTYLPIIVFKSFSIVVGMGKWGAAKERLDSTQT